MLSREFTVNVEEGLHARPASLLAQVCQKYECSISMKSGVNVIDPKGIFGILALAAKKGDCLTVFTEGIDEKEAMNDIAGLFERNFQEDRQ